MLVLLFNTVPLPIQKLAISFHNLVNAVSKIFLVFHETICAEFIRETFGSHLAKKLRVIWRCRLPSNTQIRSWRQNRSITPLTLIYLYLLLVRISDGPKNKRQPVSPYLAHTLLPNWDGLTLSGHTKHITFTLLYGSHPVVTL